VLVLGVMCFFLHVTRRCGVFFNCDVYRRGRHAFYNKNTRRMARLEDSQDAQKYDC